MQKEDFYVPDNVNIENINALSKEQSIIFEKRICELSELADEAVRLALELSSDFGIYELLGFISEGVSFSDFCEHGFALPKNASKIKGYLNSLSVYDRAVFSDLFLKKLREVGISVSEKAFLPDGNGDLSVVYVKNRLSDEAYDVFADMLVDSTVSYAESFRDAALAVAEGKKEYCILPLEENDGARLATIAALLYKHDLKISSVTPVFGIDGSADVKYALVSKHFSIPTVNPDDDRYLEIRLRADGSLTLSELFSASDMLGATVYRINTVKFKSDEGDIPYYTIVFRDEENDFSNLLVFLTLFAGGYTAVGIYKNLE